MFHVAGNKASETDFTTFQIGVGNILNKINENRKQVSRELKMVLVGFILIYAGFSIIPGVFWIKAGVFLSKGRHEYFISF